MSAHTDQTIYPLNIHLLTSRTMGFFIVIPQFSYFHGNLLLVEVGGTAPPSSSTFNPYQRIVLYLYHIGGKLSIPYNDFFIIFIKNQGVN